MSNTESTPRVLVNHLFKRLLRVRDGSGCLSGKLGVLVLLGGRFLQPKGVTGADFSHLSKITEKHHNFDATYH